MSGNSAVPLVWFAGGQEYRLDFSRPLIMGVVNITPDSFSDGGLFFSPEAAINLAHQHLSEGADILDLGGETTRPGSSPTDADEEWRRIKPVLASLADLPSKPIISVDTYKAGVAERAIQSGASIINDIYAARRDPDILSVAAEYGVPIILMHMLGEPRTMQVDPRYDDVVREVREFLLERAEAAQSYGIHKDRIILDPGLGFGKNADHNLTLINNFDRVIPEGYHSLMALSRKAFLGRVLEGAEPLKRDLATAVASAIAITKGAEMIRVHNVGPSAEAAKVAWAVRRETLRP